MKVVLLQDIKSSGKKGDLINVSDGYARNYLFPRKLAKPADSQALNEIKNAEEAKAFKLQQEKEAAEAIKAKVDGKSVKVFSKAGQNGKLFGSITAKEIAAEIQKQHGCAVDKKKIDLAADIKAFGTYEFTIKLMSGVAAKMYVVVGEQE